MGPCFPCVLCMSVAERSLAPPTHGACPNAPCRNSTGLLRDVMESPVRSPRARLALVCTTRMLLPGRRCCGRPPRPLTRTRRLRAVGRRNDGSRPRRRRAAAHHAPLLIQPHVRPPAPAEGVLEPHVLPAPGLVLARRQGQPRQLWQRPGEHHAAPGVGARRRALPHDVRGAAAARQVPVSGPTPIGCAHSWGR